MGIRHMFSLQTEISVSSVQWKLSNQTFQFIAQSISSLLSHIKDIRRLQAHFKAKKKKSPAIEKEQSTSLRTQNNLMLQQLLKSDPPLGMVHKNISCESFNVSEYLFNVSKYLFFHFLNQDNNFSEYTLKSTHFTDYRIKCFQ